MRRVTQYQTAGVNARLRLFALLEAQGVPASEADDLEAGAVAGAQGEVVELGGMAPAPRGVLFADGWDEGVMAVSEALEVSRAGDGHGAAAGGVRPGVRAAARLSVHHGAAPGGRCWAWSAVCVRRGG
ncbi:hypothetical protein WQO_34360 (plasmid) [Streptomyces globisporus C-1027]|uniref:Uncharacterized protein n=1 Tax=Streptomyces globisporus C-1027 TaxID=1172567 RepID=A0A0U3M7W0_STRGL|nr:hypothetical protein WQO_33655 [Streptomyces globisporus C-1027]ALU98405.1 hypothetical protein WQO_33665 [Streptomyces globisporus C-1027]ALU98524.1 hypothetical protein WQO_34360 [Streptomyces globisporus C-1027]